MSMKRALQVLLGVGLFGSAFSGVLSYRELFGVTAASCPAPGAPGTVFGYPACVYGFFMSLVVSAVAIAGLSSRDPRSHRSRPSSGLYPPTPMLTPKR
jgi:hypothetical protein